MPVRSLRQEEAVERAALLSVTSYDIADRPHRPGRRSRLPRRQHDPLHGHRRGVDVRRLLRRGGVGHAQRRAAARSRGGPDRAGRTSPRTTSWSSPPSRATPSTGAGVHRAVDPGDDNVYLWTTFEPDEARYAWACFDQPDLKAPHAFTVTAPPRGRWSATPATRVVEDVDGRAAVDLRADAAAVDVQPGRGGRSVRRGAAARPVATTSASTPARRWRLRWSATPSSSSPSPRRASTSSASASACPSRSAATTRCSCPSSAGRWRTTAASPGPTASCAATSPPPASGRCSPTCCCTRWRTCGSATSSRCAGGTTSGSTRPSPSSPACGPPSARPPTATPPPTTWSATSSSPTSPTRGPARTPSASPCPPWPTPSRSSTPSPIPRAPRCSSSSCTSSARTPSAPA